MESYRTAIYGVHQRRTAVHWHHAALERHGRASRCSSCCAFSLVMLVLGVIVFKRLEPAFAKVL